MRFIGSVPTTNGVFDPDPIASPGTVLDENLVGHGGEGPLGVEAPLQRLLLAFLGAGGSGSTTVEIWALDQVTADGAAGDRKFYRVATGVVLNHAILTEVKDTVPARGPFYIRQTAGTTDGQVKVAVQAG